MAASSETIEATTNETIRAELSARGLLEVAERIAHAHGVSLAEMMGRRRLGPFAAARSEFMIYLRERGLSLPAIGRILHRDHTTVIFALRRAGVSTCAPARVRVADRIVRVA